MLLFIVYIVRKYTQIIISISNSAVQLFKIDDRSEPKFRTYIKTGPKPTFQSSTVQSGTGAGVLFDLLYSYYSRRCVKLTNKYQRIS